MGDINGKERMINEMQCQTKLVNDRRFSKAARVEIEGWRIIFVRYNNGGIERCYSENINAKEGMDRHEFCIGGKGKTPPDDILKIARKEAEAILLGRKEKKQQKKEKNRKKRKN